MSKQALILTALQGSNDVWTVLKRDWFKNKLPGTPYTPGEFMIRLLIGRLALTAEDIYEALEKAEEVSVEGLKKEGVLSGTCRLNEDSVKILLATLLDIPEIAAAEYEPEAVQPVEQAYASNSVPEPELHVQESKVTECPHCAHDFERCQNGFYETVEVVESPVVVRPEIPVSSAVGCEHVDSQNKCVGCTEEDKRDCANCGETCIELKLTKCKDFDECDNAYCSQCVEEYIGSTGFCTDCGTIDCDGCDTELENGTQKRCKNPDCEKQEDYCPECALALLNKKGLCATCSGEEVLTCDGDCSGDFTESLLIKCKNFDECSHSYCAEDAKSALNKLGYCSDCETVTCSDQQCSEDIERGTEIVCKNPECTEKWTFCGDCSKRYLNKQKLCSSCSGEEEHTCDGDCGEVYTESLLKKCKNYDTCSMEYCFADGKTELDKRGFCPDCSEARASRQQ